MKRGVRNLVHTQLLTKSNRLRFAGARGPHLLPGAGLVSFLATLRKCLDQVPPKRERNPGDPDKGERRTSRSVAMAKQGAKKMKDVNKKHMDFLLRLILTSNVIYIVVRMAIMHSSFTWKHWIGLMVTSAAYFLPYKQLASMAQPVYSDKGDLLDGGFDLNTGGICEYLHDVIYITLFVQLTTIISEKFWWTYLVIPSFAGYKIFGLLRGTFFSGGSEGEVEDEKTRKKREKMEKKASRGKMIKTRTR